MAHLAIVAPFACAARAAPSGDAVQRAVERVYGASTYQREMPDVQMAPPPRRPPPGEVTVPLGDGIVTYLLGGVLVIVLVMIAMRLLGGGWRWSRADDSADAVPTPGAARSQRVEAIARLDDADQAAADGDWAQAIHILLLTSIDRLRRQTGQGVPVALTARELIHHLKLADQARGDLAALVGAAELCHFGGRPADRALYDSVRTHYERLWRIAPQEAA
ncbi:MAG: hypothetical protein AB7O88_11150 [Reyranellaceae bacterium]